MLSSLVLSQSLSDLNLLKRIKVFCMKFLFANRGVKKDLAHDPATVTEVSCPSFAILISVVSCAGGETYSYWV